MDPPQVYSESSSESDDSFTISPRYTETAKQNVKNIQNSFKNELPTVPEEDDTLESELTSLTSKKMKENQLSAELLEVNKKLS